MSAEENRLDQDISKLSSLGILAGGGNMPHMVKEACYSYGITPFIVAFEGQADPSLVEGCEHMWGSLGKAGAIIKTLKAHNIKDLVLIGSIERPSFSDLKPDLKTAEFLTKVGLNALGDNSILESVRSFLEKEGFRLHGAHKFAHDLLSPEGLIGRHKPTKANWIDIERGFEVSQVLGHADVGQSVIVQEGLVIGVEAIEGTDELIKRCAGLFRGGRKGVLVKTCKPQQDQDLDLPTIGPDTIELAAHCGLGGVAVHAGQSLIYDRQRLAEIADKHKLYVVGITSDQFER